MIAHPGALIGSGSVFFFEGRIRICFFYFSSVYMYLRDKNACDIFPKIINLIFLCGLISIRVNSIRMHNPPSKMLSLRTRGVSRI